MANGLVTLKTRADFLRVAATRCRAVRPGLMLQAGPRPAEVESGGAVRIGYTASRKVGNAVMRNRAKRRLRAVAAEILSRNGQADIDYVLIARADTAARGYAELAADLEGALRQVGRQLREPPRRGRATPRDGRTAVAAASGLADEGDEP